MAIQVGDRVPRATFMTSTEDGPAPLTTDDVFAGKRVALFALPGAFTPTCSARHLPGFKDRAGDLAAKGIDSIVCLSVNDVFVMKAWGKDQGINGEVLLVADGNGEFTKAVGLEMDGTKYGMGLRSQRYSMVVNDGVVEQLNLEEGGQFEVSSADYLVDHL